MPDSLGDLVGRLLGAARSDPFPGDAPAPAPSLAQHVASRLTYGARAGDVAEIEAMGVLAWLQQQLVPFAIDDAAADAIAATHPANTFGESWAQLYDRRTQAYEVAAEPFFQVRHRTIVRRVHSRRQLYERMVEFWHDHFNIFGPEFIVISMFGRWDDALRTHALGNFRALLDATLRQPAMLYYLDNYANRAGNPNENYARELLELHTMGEENYSKLPFGSYDPTQSYIDWDVYALRLILTGFTFETGSAAADRGQFKVIEANHSRELKIFLGQIFPPDQNAEPEAARALDMVCSHPATARHVCAKLIRRFVSEQVPQRLLDDAAARWQARWQSPTQIAEVLELILRSPEFEDAACRATKFRRPLDWAIAAYRALGLTYRSDNVQFFAYVNPMGQPMFEWRSPDGPPDEFAAWATSSVLVQRWNMIYRIASGWDVPWGLSIGTSAMPASLVTAREVADWWIDRVIQRPVSERTRWSVRDFIGEGRNWDLPLPTAERDALLPFVAALCAMTPEFNRC